MTYPELTNKVHEILHSIFGDDANNISDALSLEEAFGADSLDKAFTVSSIWATLNADITDEEVEKLQSYDGYTGIMIITYINFIAKKLNIAIPADRKQYELNMRALKRNTQPSKTIRTNPEQHKIQETLQKIDETIERINLDAARRAQILNRPIRHHVK